ncbi:YbaY family lipoprotein [Pelagibacterium sp. 26DY04]|uniref:YbaY family lipoprotein n=1 Tax=Pelagibacterium sp. 26DY04 TaxID=2967130 RepID=UPI0028165BBA|nr:YbaY family lipoprotein [Pelagibacterium sp. 26DY04]WMT87229.1 YbaY family lipoprotein [Pelagibacterium sp. 26DY04]
MRVRSPVFSIAAFSVLLMGGAAMADDMTITGDISYRERIALPDNAVATVSLVDVSLADAPAQTLAQDVIDPAGQVPIGFILNFDSDDIVAGHSYAITARIEVGGELWFINDTRVSVDPENHDAPVSVPLVNARGVSDTPADETATGETEQLPGTSWTLVALAGEPIAEDVESTLIFGEDDGSVGGNGGCNSYGGSIAYQEDGTIEITEVFSTMMACQDPKMSTERELFDALGAATSYAIEGETLTLIDEGGTALAEFAAEASE